MKGQNKWCMGNNMFSSSSSDMNDIIFALPLEHSFRRLPTCESFLIYPNKYTNTTPYRISSLWSSPRRQHWLWPISARTWLGARACQVKRMAVVSRIRSHWIIALSDSVCGHCVSVHLSINIIQIDNIYSLVFKIWRISDISMYLRHSVNRAGSHTSRSTRPRYHHNRAGKSQLYSR